MADTHSALQSFCHASWYLTGSSCKLLASRSAESMYCRQRGEEEERKEENQDMTNRIGCNVSYKHAHVLDTDSS